MIVKSKMKNGNILELRVLSEEKRYGEDVYVVCKSSAPTNHYKFYFLKSSIIT